MFGIPCRLALSYARFTTLQWEEFGEDRCDNNLIRGNTIITNGNECVEVKEGSSGNMIEENDCTSQHDSESGCYVSRGDENTIRFERGCSSLV